MGGKLKTKRHPESEIAGDLGKISGHKILFMPMRIEVKICHSQMEIYKIRFNLI